MKALKALLAFIEAFLSTPIHEDWVRAFYTHGDLLDPQPLYLPVRSKEYDHGRQ